LKLSADPTITIFELPDSPKNIKKKQVRQNKLTIHIKEKQQDGLDSYWMTRHKLFEDSGVKHGL
jgi:hypothetical protein